MLCASSVEGTNVIDTPAGVATGAASEQLQKIVELEKKLLAKDEELKKKQVQLDAMVTTAHASAEDAHAVSTHSSDDDDDDDAHASTSVAWTGCIHEIQEMAYNEHTEELKNFTEHVRTLY